ncbi:hypothetical protein [Bacillus pseudomycoides]|uniref:hypothetical protein n=1 Tax=Bacillus pseudomycoides TaxID=64104 RepID=UPI000BF19F60|nr:hypothetical protein [Bacillus pseudomycoides]PEK34107.1 hypothetical protein CN691_12890 [Bacillus pseudomycoides]
MKRFITFTMIAVSSIGLLTACANKEEEETYNKAKNAVEDRYKDKQFESIEICKTNDNEYLTVKATDKRGTDKYIYIKSKNETRMATNSPLFKEEKSCKVFEK